MKQLNLPSKILIAFLIIIILMMIVFTAIYSSPSKISIVSGKTTADENEIESIVISKKEKKTGKTGTYVNISDASQASMLKDYARISTLHISNTDSSSLKDITGLEVHTIVLDNVKNFDFSLLDTESIYSVTLINSPIADYSPLSQSNNLTSISMSQMDFNADAFKKVGAKLKELNLSDMKLKDISFLKSTPILEKLTICNCNLSGITHISHLNNLKELNLSLNNISDISPVKSLKNLRFIVLDRNNIKGCADFSQMKNLTDVYAPFNHINEIKLHTEAAPSSLNLSYNDITYVDDEFIDTISACDCRVNLFGNMISDYSSPAGVPNIIYQDETIMDFSYTEHEQYMNEIKRFSREYIDPSWTESKKAAVTFCVLSSRIKYFHNYKSSSKKEAEYVHTGYGALINNLAVCDGLAYVYRDILRYEGINSYIYHGDIDSVSDDSTHAWNIIYIDSVPYHADLTAGVNSEFSSSKFKYYDMGEYIERILSVFGKSDIQMEKNGYFLLDKNAPGCTQNISSYALSDLIYDISEGEEKYFFIDKNIFVEMGEIFND